jgi:thiamine pyrophosphokinase
MGTSSTSVALVFTGGAPPSSGVVADLLDALGPEAIVIAADSGLDHATALGVHVDLLVGDLDSADPATVALAEASGTHVERHEPEKDATDLELALTAARALGCSRTVVVGEAGGRVDHFLGNALLLASPEFASMTVEANFDGAHVHVVRDALELHGESGDLISLLALGGPAHGIVTRDLRFPLRHETLHPGSTRGVSNELTSSTAYVSLTDGVLLAVLPSRKAPS